MQTILLLIALSLCAAAQTIGGLPEHSITLLGNPDSPQITNQSGRAIIAVVLRYEAESRLPSESGFARLYFLGTPIAADSVARSLNAPTTRTSAGKFARISIDSVLFEDGAFSGPDTQHQLATMSQFLALARELGGKAAESDWGSLDAIVEDHSQPVSEDDRIARYQRRNIAADLKRAHREGNGAALAHRFKGVPEARKENQ